MIEAHKEEIQISSYKFNKSDVLGKGSTGTVYLGNTISIQEPISETVRKSPSKLYKWTPSTTKSSSISLTIRKNHSQCLSTPTSSPLSKSYRKNKIAILSANTAQEEHSTTTSKQKVIILSFRQVRITISHLLPSMSHKRIH